MPRRMTLRVRSPLHAFGERVDANAEFSCYIGEKTSFPYRIVGPMEDKLLVLQCKRGSTKALGRVYEKYRRDLLVLAIALLNDKAAAEDIVHDAFVSFTETLPRFRLTGSLKAFLMTCVANRARNHNKTRRARDAACNDSLHGHAGDQEPVERLVCNEQLQRLAAALDRLPYEQRETLMLHMHGGLSLRAIARTWGLSANTVMSRYRYAIEKLRSMLNGECDNEI